MKRIRLNIIGLSNSQTQSGAYALILGEERGNRRLPIIIGAFEAQSIFVALEKEISPPRPLTHDLFKSFADRFQVSLKEVLIHKIKDGIFYASLVCLTENGEEIIDARTSDAIALAVRFNCGVFTYEEILKKAGIILDKDIQKSQKKDPSTNISKEENPNPTKKKSTLSKLSKKRLQKELNEAIKNENYERAATLRDELTKRKKS